MPRKIGEIAAIDDVSFDINQGEILGCVGGSGSGKSILGRMLLNLVRPEAGEVIFEGRNIAGLSEPEMRPYRRNLQIIFQEPLNSLNPRRTVAENIARPLLNFGESRESAFRRVRDLMDIVGLLPSHANRYPHQFSGGQCQRIGIARALALKPRFLFLDEPVSALDVSIQAQILNLLKDLRDEFDLTYFLVANDLKVVEHFSDRVMILYQGKIVEIGTAKQVNQAPLHPYTQSFLRSALHMSSGDEWQTAAIETESLNELGREEAVEAAAGDRKGCIYGSSCGQRLAICASKSPEMTGETQMHTAACHLLTGAAPQHQRIES
ncbi:Putative oligopeptide ABC transporter ATP-binding protein (plasmid) [Sinorhizobium fredii HH103]|uniref:Oligopeptide ABC transporter ATP-binding protein n=1 Tax=Sinorhizobium fredii (strain HH103) TaxID=1117943 RepID=G9AJ79_SINF1|nr:oligopeptide/dipeptide ABC transporter ATP-binding protein [Sinorhizobium fredii]CCF01111.1 Putative oligopeptide ABC transporter ATP-binding protein [Sinorhizobium fredii HH103]